MLQLHRFDLLWICCTTCSYGRVAADRISIDMARRAVRLQLQKVLLCMGLIYKISYDSSYDYRKFIVRSTYDSDLKRAEMSLTNIVS